MTEKVYDLMVARTRQLLKETLINLIEENGFNSITVRDLTQKAKLNRGTFYFHYRDKYDLMEHMQDELLEGLRQHMLSLNHQDLIKYHLQNTPYPPMVQTFQYIKANRRIFKGLLGSKGDPAFPKKLKLFFKNDFFAEVINNQNIGSIPKECYGRLLEEDRVVFLKKEKYNDEFPRKTRQQLISPFMRTYQSNGGERYEDMKENDKKRPI